MKKNYLLFILGMFILFNARAQFSQNFNAVADGSMPTGWTVFSRSLKKL